MAATKANEERQRRSAVVVIVAILLIAVVAVYAARQRWRPREVPVADQPQQPAAENDNSRDKAAHVLVCEAVKSAMDPPMVFDLAYDIEPVSDGTGRLTTAALLNGQKVDVSAVLKWDEDRQAWEIVELFVGGTALPVP